MLLTHYKLWYVCIYVCCNAYPVVATTCTLMASDDKSVLELMGDFHKISLTILNHLLKTVT